MEFVKEIVASVTTAGIGGFFAWFFTRRKYKAEAQTTEIQNIDKAAAIWRELAENLKSEMDDVLLNQKMLMEENNKLLAKIRLLELQIKNLTKELKKQV